MNIARRYGPYFIITAAVLWAFDGILRRSLFVLPPITIVFWEHLIGLLIILPFFAPLVAKEKITRKEWYIIGVISLCSGVLGTLFFTTALQRVNFIPFSVVFLLQKLQPIFAIIMARIVLGERMDTWHIKWSALGVAAAYFVTFPKGIVNFETGAGTIAAALFALAAAAAWGSSTAFSRRLLSDHSQTVITGLRFACTVILAGFLALIIAPQTFTTTLSTGQLSKLVGIALSSGLVALWIYYQGLKFTKVSTAAILELAFPVLAVFIDIFLYHTVLHWTQYLAAVILLISISRLAAFDANQNTAGENDTINALV